jgi:nucleoid-associated protein YgaU
MNTPTRRGGAPVTLASWFLLLGLITVGLHRAGTGPLAPPPVRQPELWADWLAARDPVAAAIALVRLAALGAVWYLLAASAIGAVLRLCRAQRLVRVSDRLTVPALRRLLVATAGVTLASGVTPTLSAYAGPAPPAVVAAAQATSTTVATTTGPSPPTLTMRLLPPVDVAPAPPATVDIPAGLLGEPAGTFWTVRPGECFWSIAEDVLTRAWGRTVTDAEIVPYWRTLIEQNRPSLADRSNEHLIFPGQVFSVPAPPAAPP